jgi:hypothetical protein
MQMSTDTQELASRLRFQKRYAVGQVPVTMDEAADTIEAQAAQIEELKEGAHQDGLLRVRYGKEIEALQADAERLHRLAAMEASLVHENKVCYYLRNLSELDRLIKLDKLAQEKS